MPDEHDPTGLEVARSIAAAVRGGGPVVKKQAKPARRARVQTGKTGRDPVPLASAVEALIEEQGWATEVSVHLLLARWPALVGPVNAEHAKPESYSNGVLTVRADSTAWAASLRQLAPQLVATLNEKLGQGTVTRVVALGPQAPNWKKGPRSVPGRGPRDTYG